MTSVVAPRYAPTTKAPRGRWAKRLVHCCFYDTGTSPYDIVAKKFYTTTSALTQVASKKGPSLFGGQGVDGSYDLDLDAGGGADGTGDLLHFTYFGIHHFVSPRNNAQQAFFGNGFTGAAQNFLPSSTIMEDNEWHSVAALRDGDTRLIYVDGVLAHSQSGDDTSGNANDAITFRHDTSSNRWEFQIPTAAETGNSPANKFEILDDEATAGTNYLEGGTAFTAIWKRTLTASEIAELHRTNGRAVVGEIAHPRHVENPAATTPGVVPSRVISW